MAKEKKPEIEREYIIPLREKCRSVPRYKKTNKAITSVKQFLVRHMKIYDRDLKKIKLDKYLNEFLWRRGIKNPPHKVKVKAVKDSEGVVRVELVEPTRKLQHKKAREEKMLLKASEKVSKKKVEKKEEEKKPEEVEEEKEKKAAVVEAGAEMEKAAAKQAKHQATVNSKAPKHQIRNALKK